MDLTCQFCNEPIYGGKGDYWHTATQDQQCAGNNLTVVQTHRIATPKVEIETEVNDDDTLGCPACGSKNLHQAQICFEPIVLRSDGDVEYPEGISHYGTVIMVGCDDCPWSLGKNDRDFEAVSPESIIEEHQRLVREEFLKEMRDE